MAASGGYYLASAGQVIFAERGSIVGSMGVVGGKLAFGRALGQVGVHSETFPRIRSRRPARARPTRPSSPRDDATRARVLESMTAVYDLFLSRVAEGRHTSIDAIAPFAEGRIFSGTQGREHGLVDEIRRVVGGHRQGSRAREAPARRGARGSRGAARSLGGARRRVVAAGNAVGRGCGPRSARVARRRHRRLAGASRARRGPVRGRAPPAGRGRAHAHRGSVRLRRPVSR